LTLTPPPPSTVELPPLVPLPADTPADAGASDHSSEPWPDSEPPKVTVAYSNFTGGNFTAVSLAKLSALVVTPTPVFCPAVVLSRASSVAPPVTAAGCPATIAAAARSASTSAASPGDDTASLCWRRAGPPACCTVCATSCAIRNCPAALDGSYSPAPKWTSWPTA
jgi:hypothetical protein